MNPSEQISDGKLSSVFVDARLVQVRLVNENFSATLPTSSEATVHAQLQLKTETSSGFAVGLNSLEMPTSLSIELDYKVVLSVPNSETKVVEYSSKCSATFDIVAKFGFDDWTSLPDDAFGAYFALVHQFAVRRAEGTFIDAGLKGVGLPRPAAFSKSAI